MRFWKPSKTACSVISQTTGVITPRKCAQLFARSEIPKTLVITAFFEPQCCTLAQLFRRQIASKSQQYKNIRNKEKEREYKRKKFAAFSCIAPSTNPSQSATSPLQSATLDRPTPKLYRSTVIPITNHPAASTAPTPTNTTNHPTVSFLGHTRGEAFFSFGVFMCVTPPQTPPLYSPGGQLSAGCGQLGTGSAGSAESVAYTFHDVKYT